MTWAWRTEQTSMTVCRRGTGVSAERVMKGKNGSDRRLTSTQRRGFNRYDRRLLAELLQLGGCLLKLRNQIASILIS